MRSIVYPFAWIATSLARSTPNAVARRAGRTCAVPGPARACRAPFLRRTPTRSRNCGGLLPTYIS